MSARFGLYFLTALWFFVILPLSVMAAPYAAMVMDARTGTVLHSENSETRLHPASLTKMMTLYVVFEAVENGELSMDTLIRVSNKAASEPPSKLGLRAGQKIKLRYLVRAAAIKSANDASTAIAEGISGSEAAFARRMNRTAKALGMTRTTFKNAHGLTESGHLSTAHDMTILGRHVIYDYPQYYNLFSRQSADAGVRTVSHTNQRLLSSYKGADGIKTGYTSAAGFNLVASAERGSERVIATVFGGRSTATRNARVAELLDLGFRKAPDRVAFRAPGKPSYQGGGARDDGPSDGPTIVTGTTTGGDGAAGKTIRVSGLVTRSLRPQGRPLPDTAAPVVAAVQDDLQNALVAAQALPPADTLAAVAENAVKAAEAAPTESVKPVKRPQDLVLAAATPAPEALTDTPEPEPAPVVAEATEAVQEVVTRLSTSGGRHWGVNVGRYGSRFQAEKVLLRTALAEMSALDGSLRKVVARGGGYDANFMGLTRESADLACRRLQGRGVTCFMIGPS